MNGIIWSPEVVVSQSNKRIIFDVWRLDERFYEISVIASAKTEFDTLGLANTIRNYEHIGNDRHHIVGNKIISVVEVMEEQKDVKEYFMGLHEELNH